jgi:hypothetical protein
MAINAATVMTELGVALSTISGLRVYDFPPKSAQAPFAFVDLPETISFDGTYRRGEDRMTVTVVVGVSSQVDRASADAALEYAAGSGSKSVKAAIDAATVGSSARVTQAQFGMIQLASSAFMGVTFTVDVSA